MAPLEERIKARMARRAQTEDETALSNEAIGSGQDVALRDVAAADAAAGATSAKPAAKKAKASAGGNPFPAKTAK